MSKYLETIEELKLAGYLTEDKNKLDRSMFELLRGGYNKSTDKRKGALDKHAMLVLEKLSNQEYVNNVKSIKKNLQFIVWLIIINLCAGVIYLYAA
jgi:hypothetical protein